MIILVCVCAYLYYKHLLRLRDPKINSKHLEKITKDTQTKVRDMVRTSKEMQIMQSSELKSALKSLRAKLNKIQSYDPNIFKLPEIEDLVKNVETGNKGINNLKLYNTKTLESLKKHAHLIDKLENVENELAKDQDVQALINQVDDLDRNILPNSGEKEVNEIENTIKKIIHYANEIKVIHKHDKLLTGIIGLDEFAEKIASFPNDVTKEELVTFKEKLAILLEIQQTVQDQQKSVDELESKLAYLGNNLDQISFTTKFENIKPVINNTEELQKLPLFMNATSNATEFTNEACFADQICITKDVIKKIKARGAVFGLKFEIFEKSSDTPIETGSSLNLQNLQEATDNMLPVEIKNKQVVWTGFLKPNQIDVFEVKCQSDGDLQLWFGKAALNPTKDNASPLHFYLLLGSKNHLPIRIELKKIKSNNFSFSVNGTKNSSKCKLTGLDRESYNKII